MSEKREYQYDDEENNSYDDDDNDDDECVGPSLSEAIEIVGKKKRKG